MTVITPNGITGINSLTSLQNDLSFYKSDGTALTVLNSNVNSTGVSTFTTVGITSLAVNGNNYPSAGPLSGARNIIINGSMVINQRGWTGAAGTTTNLSYTTDRFLLAFTNDGAVSVGQTSMTSGNAFDDGFQNALFLNVTTADTNLTTTQNLVILQRIEGFNLQGIKKGTANALPVTLSFWVRSSTTGTYIAELRDIDNNRQVSQAYTINVANTWEKKVLTFPADTTGAFANDNGESLNINWWLAAGPSLTSGTLNTSWATLTQANRVVGQTNLLASTGNNFWLTGVQLEVGSVATPFERRSYGQELALCQRYYYRIGGIVNSRIGVGHVLTTTAATAHTFFPVTLRDTPTTLETSGTASHYEVMTTNTNTVCSVVPTFGTASQYMVTTTFTVASGLTAGQGSNCRLTNANGYLAWSAEL